MTPPSAGPHLRRGGNTRWLESAPRGLLSRPPGAQSDWLVPGRSQASGRRRVARSGRSASVLGGLRIVGQNGVQLIARVDVQLREHLAQVVLDRAWADEEPRGDVGVREPVARELRDLALLR